MKKITIFIIIALYLGCFLVSCSTKNQTTLSIKEIIEKNSNLAAGTYSENEYIVSGYVINQPTNKNNLGKFSFNIVDNYNSPTSQITVYLATSTYEINQGDKVTIRSYVKLFSKNNLMLSEKKINDEIISTCDIIDVKKADANIKKLNTSMLNDTLTVLELATYLDGQNEHYPLSDEFVEKYQQTSGGYLDVAKEHGIVVDRQLHSPNQKWHFFTSWLEDCIKNNTIFWEDDARSNVYTRLLCPELLLWIFEASNVEPTKVRNAMIEAEKAKVNGTHIATMAKNMRNQVLWEDIVNGVRNVQINKIEGLPTSLDLNENQTIILNPIVNNEVVTFNYEINDQSIAKVTNDGQLTGINAGNTILTVTCEEYPELTKVINISVCNHGTSEKPLYIKEVIQIGKKLNLANNTFSSELFYITGIVKSINNNELVLNEEEATFIVSDYIIANGVENPLIGDEIVVKGYITNSNNLLRLTSNNVKAEVINNIRGTSTINLGKHDNAKVLVNGVEFVSTTLTNGQIFIFSVEVIENFNLVSVTINGTKLNPVNDNYSFEVSGNTEIVVIVTDSTLPSSSTYNIVYDLGDRVTPKQFNSINDLFSSFILSDNDEGILNSITNMIYIYGGANGGRGDTAWHTGNIIKFGTTSVNGSITFNFNINVNYVKITGYVYDNACKIQLGDSNSSDWTTGSITDTKLYTCSSMNEVSKKIVEAGSVSTIMITFDSTTSLTIATTNNKPLFITSIEFGINNN